MSVLLLWSADDHSRADHRPGVDCPDLHLYIYLNSSGLALVSAGMWWLDDITVYPGGVDHELISCSLRTNSLMSSM